MALNRQRIEAVMGAVLADLCHVVELDHQRYVIVRAWLPKYVSTWGVWHLIDNDEYELVAGPLSGYMPRDVGLAGISSGDWKVVEDQIPTPTNLPLGAYVLENLVKHPVPHGERMMVSVGRGSFLQGFRTRVQLKRADRLLRADSHPHTSRALPPP